MVSLLFFFALDISLGLMLFLVVLLNLARVFGQVESFFWFFEAWLQFGVGKKLMAFEAHTAVCIFLTVLEFEGFEFWRL